MTEQQSPTMDDTSAVTVETPSRLLLLFKSTLCTNISAYLPTDVIKLPIGDKVTFGRSSNSVVRLNDERMSRSYAEIWQDGTDPFMFKIRNTSDKKVLMVEDIVLRGGEQDCIKDGYIVKMDFVEFQAKVCAGDFTSSSYEISFVMNETLERSQPASEILEHSRPVSTANPCSSLLERFVSRKRLCTLDECGVSSLTETQKQTDHQQMPTDPINDLDSGFVLDTSGVYRPNIPSVYPLRTVPRCHSCRNEYPRYDSKETVYSRGRQSPCENNDVISDGTAEDNVM